ncbi:ATP-binding cassette domain-containing protein [uncultured Peptoniphilus sp.]|uniref:metal ABC transporter ATP-binding protein n=1 Tax=uncultured Peptoniphilus sp. TaxID=254354 RepID=UPI002805CC47|nr:ATP-binding cassette domain-containing protein [uncultured Peptoniphilus sp.]
MTEKILCVKNLSFSYKKEYILENIYLEIEKGDFSLLIGENGAGKSTLLKIIFGELKDYEGEISFDLLKSPHKISYVPQLSAADRLNFPITVKELLSLGIYPRIGPFKRLSRENEKQINRVLEITGMEDFKNHIFGQLSGGQRQRILIAKAIVNDIEFLILDEPTAGIDLKSKESLFDLLKYFNEEKNISIFMVTHEPKDFENLANKIYKIEDKKLERVK